MIGVKKKMSPIITQYGLMPQSDVTPFMMSAAEKYGLVGLWRWWTLGDLNPRPLECHSSDLPADLSALYRQVRLVVTRRVPPFI